MKIENEFPAKRDKVGVVVPWTHPSQDSSAEKVQKVEALFIRLVRRFNEAGNPLSS